jgi:hypothetical protein
MKQNTNGLPFGAGSIQMRGRQYWAIYRDEHGQRIQVGLDTADSDEALHLLAGRAMTVERHRVEMIEAVLNETAKNRFGPAGNGATRDARGQRRSSGTVRSNAKRGAKRKKAVR